MSNSNTMPSFIRILIALSCLLTLLPTTLGHGFLSTPRSRNLVAYEDRKYHKQDSSTPLPEDCPTCINRGGTLARCGVLRPGQGDARNYDFPKNAFGDPMPANPQNVYEENALIDVEVVLSAHHRGHFVFKACEVGFTTISPTQECFDAHPLVFVEDLLYGAPVDSNFPARAYVAPFHHPNKVYSTKPRFEKAMVFKFRLQLPEGVTGDLVLIQWYYVASNSGCAHEGYADYPWPADWILDMNENEEVSEWESKLSVGTGLKSCAGPGALPPTGDGTPEQFWNCAEVSIKPQGTLMAEMSDTAIDPSQINEQFQSDKTIIGYWASWQWYDRNKFAEPWVFDYRKYTRVNFAFFQTNENGDLWGTDSWADPNTLFGPYNWNGVEGVDTEYCHWEFPNKKACKYHHYEKGLIHLVKDAGAEIWPSIGGWSLSDPFPVMAKNPTSRANFATKCIELIEDYGFDGIDIDWEYPGYEAHSGTPDDTESYNLLLKDVREKLEELGERTGKFYGLTAALPCGTNHINNIDIPRAAHYLTELNLMTYDFFGAWSPTTGVNAPLYDQDWGGEDVARYSIDGCVKSWIEGGGMPDQINIGLPFYGRGYLKAKHFNETHLGKPDKGLWWQDEGSPQYFNIVNKLPELVSIRHELTQTQYAYNPKVVSEVEVGGMVSYDDEEAICDKTRYCMENDLNGFIVWEMSGDLMDDYSTPLIDAVHAKLRDPTLDCRKFRYDVDNFAGTATPFGNEISAGFPPKPQPMSEDGSTASDTPVCPTTWFWGVVPFKECRSYFHCTNGSPNMDTFTVCPEDELYDDETKACKEASQVTCSITGSPTPSPVSASGFSYHAECPASFSNFKAGPGCTSYYRCQDGVLVSPIVACHPGTLFDEAMSTCNFEPRVQCKVAADLVMATIAADPTPSPVTASGLGYVPECPASSSSFKAGPDCTSYYQCSHGVVVSEITACQLGTLFDETVSICNFEALVQCTTTSPPVLPPTSQPTPKPTTPQPTRKAVTDDPTRHPTTYNPTRRPVTSDPTRHPVTNEQMQRQTDKPVQSIQVQSKPLIIPQVPMSTPRPTPSSRPRPAVNMMVNYSPTPYTNFQTESNVMVVQRPRPTNKPTKKPRKQTTPRPTPRSASFSGNTMAESFLSKPTESYTVLYPSESTVVEYNTKPSKGEEQLSEKIQNQIQQHVKTTQKAKKKKKPKKKKGATKKNQRQKEKKKNKQRKKNKRMKAQERERLK